MTVSTSLRRLLPLMALAMLLAGPAAAQQPTSVNPTASSVKEKQLLDALKPNSGGTVDGRITIQDGRAGTLIQPGGRDFRALRESTVPTIGGYAILGMLFLLAIFYLFRGRVRVTGGPSGATIERFGDVSRFAHWLSATSFIALGLTGLNLVFGKALLLPFIGPGAFTAVTQAGKFVHNYVSFAFALGIILMFVLWVKDNFPSGRDITWFAQGGGLIGSKHPPAARFNGGQKLIFWSTVLGGTALAVSGYVMMFKPVSVAIGGLQLATIVHGLVGLIMVAIIAAHIYIGSVGMEGAFDAMGRGKVDLNWAKEHHSIWVDRIANTRPKDITGGRAPAPGE